MRTWTFGGNLLVSLVVALFFVTPAQLVAGGSEDAAKLEKQLMNAAPMAVVKNATLLTFGKDGKPMVVRKGTNNYTCFAPPSGDICADQATMAFFKAWQMKQDPTPGQVGFSYMLNGDNGASMTDPHAKGKTADNHWAVGGPHVMIVGASLDEYPKGGTADPTQPYVMWAGTPWAHLMVPTK